MSEVLLFSPGLVFRNFNQRQLPYHIFTEYFQDFLTEPIFSVQLQIPIIAADYRHAAV
jgi:hypothetical protein